MPRLQADADQTLWVPVTGSLGWKGRRHRKAAIRSLLGQATGTSDAPRRRGGVLAWAMSQATPLLMRKADGRVLAWVWREDPELLVVLAQVQEFTAQLRTARAMMPMEYDDTEDFRGTYLGMGERLVIDLPQNEAASPSASYTWDTGSHLVSVNAVCNDRSRFGTVIGAVDEIARSLRLVEDVAAGESQVLRIDPA